MPQHKQFIVVSLTSCLSTTATMPLFLPGDVITAVPTLQKPNAKLRLGPGLAHTPPSTVTAHKAGELVVDARKPALWLESNGRRVQTPPSPPCVRLQ